MCNVELEPVGYAAHDDGVILGVGYTVSEALLVAQTTESLEFSAVSPCVLVAPATASLISKFETVGSDVQFSQAYNGVLGTAAEVGG